MTRLPWQHTRSRTKSGSEKSVLSHPQDWFSRATAEPSRQAFSDLVKAHNRVKSDESSSSRSTSRPRASTAASSRSQRQRSRSGFSDDEAWSRPSSRHAYEDQTNSSPERPEASNKVLLNKGGILVRRTSSILSLSSATSSSTLGLTSPPRSSRASSAASRADDLRTKISPPFDFQHITHTDDTQFSGLGRIDESALSDQYIAATMIQATASGLRGIAASDIKLTVAHEDHQTISSNVAAVISDSQAVEQVPQSPPRPPPPPKDERNSLVRRSHNSVNDQPLESAGLMWLAAHPAHSKEDLMPRDCSRPTILDSKPLPDLPVVHAITTKDDTAREMIASPLPSPPPLSPFAMDNMQVPRPGPHRQHSSISLRSQNLYPSTKSSMPNLLAASHFLTAPKPLARHHSDMALSQQARNISATASTRTSMSFAAVDTMNWEDAVDEAWDDADGTAAEAQPEETRMELLAIESAGSTPLMMNSASCGPPKSPNRTSSAHGAAIEVHQLESVKEDEPTIDLTGLGISACPASGATSSVPRLSRSSSINFSKRRSSSSHHGNDTLTRSSSQESMIMSIASSIGGTQRSSNSSVSVAELNNMYGSHAEDCNHREQGERDESHAGAGKARPESGCLPPDILEQVTQFGSTFSANQTCNTEDVPPVPPVPQHTHNKSTSRLLVPERRSSIVGASGPGSSRKRSNTWGNRPRQAPTVSYSIFPSTQTMSYTAVTTS